MFSYVFTVVFAYVAYVFSRKRLPINKSGGIYGSEIKGLFFNQNFLDTEARLNQPSEAVVWGCIVNRKDYCFKQSKSTDKSFLKFKQISVRFL